MSIEWEFASHVKEVWEPYRIKVLKGGRGGIKSWTAARYHLIDGYRQPLRILCGREVQKSIRESVHQLLSDQIELLGLGAFYDVLSTEIRGKNGTRIVYAGISQLTTESIKSYEGYDRFWGEEAQSFTRRSLDILEPTFRKEGSELMFTLNPELDTDEVWVRYIENPPDDTLVLDCSYHKNPWFPKVLENERQKFLRQVEMGKREQFEYDWIWEGKTKPAVEGAIYAKQVSDVVDDGRLTHVPHDPKLHTHLVWDLGYNDNTTIGFVQRSGSSVRFIDYIEDSHRTYESYVNQIREIVGKKGYRIALDGRDGGKAWLPHDGKATRPDTGKSPNELLRDYGLKTGTNSKGDDGVPDIGIKGRIEAGRQMFPRCLFDARNCTPLFNRLRRYSRKVSPETGQPSGIKKDGNDHAGDMFTYVAVIEKELTNESEKMEPIRYDNAGIV